MKSALANSVLMVCVGNICRSPMAEAMLAERVSESYPQLKIASAGVGALVNHQADQTAQELMEEMGIDLASHRAQQLSSELLSEYDLVLVMEEDHIQAVHDILPAARGRVHLLGKWSDFEIPDPYRQPRQEFESALELIERAVGEWQQRFWPE